MVAMLFITFILLLTAILLLAYIVRQLEMKIYWLESDIYELRLRAVCRPPAAKPKLGIIRKLHDEQEEEVE